MLARFFEVAAVSVLLPACASAAFAHDKQVSRKEWVCVYPTKAVDDWSEFRRSFENAPAVFNVPRNDPANNPGAIVNREQFKQIDPRTLDLPDVRKDKADPSLFDRNRRKLRELEEKGLVGRVIFVMARTRPRC